MSWKSSLKAGDLDPNDRLELTCRKCRHVRYLTAADIHAHKRGDQLWLDEVEMRAKCRQRGCGGSMRMAWLRKDEASGFVGGIA